MDDIPSDYLPEAHLSLEFSTGFSPVTVVRPFNPFSMSQVLLVRIEQNSSNLPLPLNSCVILKVYDPRFFEHRTKFKTQAHPWALEHELAAVPRFKSDPDFDYCPYPEDDDKVGWEVWYYQQMETAFRNEISSYRHLAALQGTGVPSCFGSGTLKLADRAITPHVVLLEYIPHAIDLRNIADDPELRVAISIPHHLIESLIQTVSDFGKLGVTHSDLTLDNIMFSPGIHPTRAVIIDFGNSYFREDESDEEWREIVREQKDVFYVKRALRHSLGKDIV